MTVLVVTAMAEEADAITKSAAVSGVEAAEIPLGSAWTLRVGSHDVTVVLTGIGLVNAAAVTAHAIARFAPSTVVVSGVAGGLAQGIFVGDVVVGTAYAYYDANSVAFGYARGQVPGMPEMYSSDSHLHAVAASTRLPEQRIRPGKIVSGNSFVTSELVDEVRTAFPNALAADMESAAVAQVAYMHDLPVVAIRAISDLCGPTAGQDFHMSLDAAAERAAAVTLNVIPRL